MIRVVILMSSSDRHDALFVVGSLDETLELRGLRYHPIDIETSVSRAHRSIAERWVHLAVGGAHLPSLLVKMYVFGIFWA